MVGRRSSESWLVGQLPQLVLLLSLFVSVFPWRFPGMMQFTPLFDLMFLYYWSLYRPQACSDRCVFLYGVLKDLIFGTIFGLSSLILLLFKSIVSSQTRVLRHESFLVVWCGFVLLSALIQSIHLVASMLLQGGALSLEYPVIQWMLSVAVYPAIHLICYHINMLFPKALAHA